MCSEQKKPIFLGAEKESSSPVMLPQMNIQLGLTAFWWKSLICYIIVYVLCDKPLNAVSCEVTGDLTLKSTSRSAHTWMA